MPRTPGRSKSDDFELSAADKRFAAHGMYAESMVQSALGNHKKSIEALERVLEIDPQYAPAILGVGSVEYQRGKVKRGRKLLLSLISLPADAADEGERDLADIIDKAGDFLIQSDNYADGLALYRAAVVRFPDTALFYQGIGCCASYERLFGEAIAASEKAVALEPENQEFVLAHQGCNNRKRDLLAALPHLERWRQRNEDRGHELTQRFDERSLLHSLDGSHQVARWAYQQAENVGAHVWLSKSEVVPLDPGWRSLF